MNRILKLHTDEILVNDKYASDVLNNACRREGHPMKVVGMVPHESVLIFTLEETREVLDLEYHFSMFPNNAEDDIVGEINSRFFAGFSTICGFELNGNVWGLFVYSPSTNT